MTSPFNIPCSCEEGTWETDRWSGRHDSDRWPEAFPKPRTCSYCGSVHPDDLIALVEQGWEMEQSTKSYKTYWHPPGYHTAMQKLMTDMNLFHEAPEASPYADPVPPVKLYGNHLTQEHADRINKILADRYSKREGELK